MSFSDSHTFDTLAPVLRGHASDDSLYTRFEDTGDGMSPPGADDNWPAAEWLQMTFESNSNFFLESGLEWTEHCQTVTMSRPREDESSIDNPQSVYPVGLQPFLMSVFGHLPVLDLAFAPAYGKLPEYWKRAYFDVVVVELEVWQIDGLVCYRRTVIRSPPRRSPGNDALDLPAEWDDPEWPYTAEKNLEDTRWPGSTMNDDALLLFLIDHDCGNLWNVLMGMEAPPANKREYTVITLGP